MYIFIIIIIISAFKCIYLLLLVLSNVYIYYY